MALPSIAIDSRIATIGVSQEVSVCLPKTRMLFDLSPPETAEEVIIRPFALFASTKPSTTS